jgi:cysteine synthase A
MKDRMALAMVEAALADGRMTAQLTRDMIAAAKSLAEAPGSYWADQLNNSDQLQAYHRMAEEIWRDTGGAVDAFVQSVGTAGCARLVGRAR